MNAGLATLFAALISGQAAPIAEHESKNFVVYADTGVTAKRIAEAAERGRSELAKRWLGGELSDWPVRCRIEVDVGSRRPGGVTEVTYAEDKVLFHRLKVSGPLAGILKGPLPHELTHLLLAHHLRMRVPRWADEGAAILSEDETQRRLHDKAFRGILADDRCFPLRQLLTMNDYPADIPCFYAQGHSVTQFLVDAKGHKAFVAFVGAGPQRGWGEAVQAAYGYDSIEDLERAWLTWERQRKIEDLPIR